MKSIFSQSPVFHSDCFVADYSEHDRIHNITPSRKVSITDVPPSIDHFHLVNRQSIGILAVNLEQYPTYCNGNNCEAILTSYNNTRHPWILFIELKYCQPHNPGQDTERCLSGHCSKAIEQLTATVNRIVDAGLISRDSHHIYVNFVAFGLDVPEPFTAFNLTQDAITDFKYKTGITILSNCTLLAATASHIFTLKK